MIEGALNRMSLTNRTTSPNRLPRAYSARKVPARMPVGVPTSVAMRVIAKLPAMALRRPPLLPGGGVICVNRDGVIALTPLISSVPSTSTSHSNPNAVAATDSPMTSQLVRRRRSYSSITSAPRLPLKPDQQQFGQCQNDEGDDEQDQPEGNQRRQVKIPDRLGELIGERRRDRRAGLQQGGMDVVRVADHEGDRHRLAEGAAEPEQNAAEYPDARIGEHHPPHHLGGRRAEREGALAQYRRHRLEHVAHDRGDERQHHDRQDEPGGQHADAERWAFEQQADSRDHAQRVDQRRLDMFLDEGGEHEQTPDAVNDAW